MYIGYHIQNAAQCTYTRQHCARKQVTEGGVSCRPNVGLYVNDDTTEKDKRHLQFN